MFFSLFIVISYFESKINFFFSLYKVMLFKIVNDRVTLLISYMVQEIQGK